MTTNITGPRTHKLAAIVPQGPKKIPIDEQWVLALRRFVRKSLEHAEYVVKELEERHTPDLRHAKGCRAEDNDDLQCSPKCPDRELRSTLKCIRARMHELIEQTPIRKFGVDEEYHFPTRDGYTALVAEIEYLRDKLEELAPSETPRLGAPEIVLNSDPKRGGAMAPEQT